MATLTGQSIANSYKDLLQVSNSNSGIDSTGRIVSDGEGTSSTLYLSSSYVGVGAAGEAPLHVYKAAVSQKHTPEELLRLEQKDEGVDMSAGHGPALTFYVGETGGSDHGGSIAVVKEAEGDADSSSAMTFYTAGDDTAPVEVMRIDSSGNVGIGEDSPGSKLSIAGGGLYISGSSEHTDTGESLNLWNDASGHTYMASYDVTFKTGSNSARSQIPLFLDPTGNVGIGTAAPRSLLHVDGTNAKLYLSCDSGDSSIGIMFDEGDTGTTQAEIGYLTSDNSLHFKTGSDGANDALIIDNAGNVGIGTGTVDELLHLQSATSGKPVLKIENTNTDGEPCYLEFHKTGADEADGDEIAKINFFHTDSGNNVTRYASIITTSEDITDGNEDGKIRFSTFKAGADTNSFVIESGGVNEPGGVLKENLLTNSGFDVWSNSTLENVGSELVTNGTMEADSTWIAYSTPSTEERSSTQAHAGTYSWKVITDGGDEGIRNPTAIAVTVGKLYRVSVWIYNTNAARDFKISLNNSTASLSTDVFQEEIGQNAWTEISAVFECTASGDIDTQEIRIIDSGTTAYIDDFSLYEVTPGCVAADNVAMDGWYKQTSMDLHRSHSDGATEAVTKAGSFYALKMTPDAQNDYATFPDYAFAATEPWYSRFAGRTVTFGAWVKSSTASDVKLLIRQTSGDTDSVLHDGDGDWQWIEVTATMATNTTRATFMIRQVAGSPGVCYISQPMLVFGSSIGEGNYTRPQGEIVWCEKTPTIHDNNTPVAADDKILNLEALSSGMIPKGAMAVCVTGEVENSSITSDQGIRFGRDSSNKSDVVIYPSVNAVRQRGNGWVRCDANGDIYQEVTEAGATLSALFLNATAVQLR